MAEGAALVHRVGPADGDQRVPRRAEERQRLRHHVRRYAAEEGLVAPLSLDELKEHTRCLLRRLDQPSSCHDFVAVLLGNAVWEGIVASVPYERRILLLPQCLRDRGTCPAELDEFGLLCEQCGACATGSLQGEAEALGYQVLIAEGNTMVGRLLASGQVEAVVGVSCLDALERSFPHATAAAVPAIAIPLLGNGCHRTEVDLEWVREAIRLHAPSQPAGRLDLDGLRDEVRGWFDPGPLGRLLEPDDETGRIAMEWMAAGGKRWRPFLAACVARALAGPAGVDQTLRHLAVAVECFHKASLVHDDIEDDDDVRYQAETLHRRHGMPIALNVGDLLVGEGYRLISQSGAAPDRMARMLAAAAEGHRALCLGQGKELSWRRAPGPLSVPAVLDIFRLKTAPAFEVALVLGALSTGADDATCEVLRRFSNALGTAYQIRDDVEDFRAADADDDLELLGPSLLAALAREQAGRSDRDRLTRRLAERAWADYGAELRRIVVEAGLEQRAWQIYGEARKEALAALQPLAEHRLKRVLFRLVHKVLPDPPDSAGVASVHGPHPHSPTPLEDAPSQGDERVVSNDGW